MKYELEFNSTIVDRAKRRKAMLELGACASLWAKCHALAVIACSRHRSRDVTVRLFPWL